MFTLKEYQKKAKRDFRNHVKALDYADTISYLKAHANDAQAQADALTGRTNPFRIQIDAPTGSGKTVLMGEIIKDEFQDHVVFWFSPGAGDLEEQSARSLRKALGNSGVERMDESTFNFHPAPGIVYIGNWEQFVSRDRKTGEYKNRVVREGDNKNFFDMIHRIAENYIPVTIVVDEAHFGSNKSVGAIQSFLKDIEDTLTYSPLYVQLSATHILEAKNTVKISIQDVIAEGLIRKEVLLNSEELLRRADSLSVEERDSEAIEPLMIRYAVDLLDQIDEEYKKIDAHALIKGQKVPYHGLIGMQVPNGAVGNALMERAEAVLRDRKDAEGNLDPITRDNGKLAVYLSDDKTENMAGIESPDSPVRVLFYKQGVSTGWDCPRAQILLGFRHITSHVFTKQNLGRFVRTTQAKHYNNDLLDKAYVISNVGDLGQAAFNEQENKSGIPVKEPVSLNKKEGYTPLLSFNEAKIPVSHYAAKNQTTVSLREVSGLFLEKANESRLWESLAYAKPVVDYAGLISAVEDMTDGINEFKEDSSSEAHVAKTANELSVLFQAHVLVAIKETGKTFRNDSQVARSLSQVFVSWYGQALLNKESTHERKAHFGKLSDNQEGNTEGIEWNRFAFEQALYVDAHRNTLLSLVKEIVLDPRAKASDVVVDKDNAELQSWADREYHDDGTFFISPLHEFYVNPEKEPEVGEGLAHYMAITGRVHEGSAKMSEPEKMFQNEFLPTLFNGAENSLKSFYKSPENKTGSFCRAVKVTDDKVTNFYPDWLLELVDSDGVVSPAVVESKSGTEISKVKSDPTHPTYAKALDLVELAENTGIKAGIVYKDATGWNIITGKDDEGTLTSSPAKEYFTVQK